MNIMKMGPRILPGHRSITKKTVTRRPFLSLRKRPGNITTFFVSFLVYLIGVFPSVLYALPTDGTVTAGTATIDPVSPDRMNIIQGSDKAIIDWNSFNIGVNEHVDFQLPSSSSVTLNRVTGNDPSSIFGKLTSNGNLMLINRNGILFGPSSMVDVNGLLATTSDISNADFMAGLYRFNIAPELGGVVENRGMINAAQGGLVALVAPGVLNSGIINARLGRVSLASGNTFTLDLYGDQLISLGVDSKVLQQVTGLDGQQLSSYLSNSGGIYADGGIVAMNVNAAGYAVDSVINMSGVVQARSVQQKNGTIILSGGQEGTVNVSGTLDASGLGAGETGGTIHVLGDRIALLDRSILDVSGDLGGGTLLAGGDYQGKGTVQNASETYVSPGASIYADAISGGNGGRAIFWADRRTRFFGRLTARGGREYGDGGFVEVSGKEELAFDGSVDTLAPNGKAGTLLLDPTDIIIATGFVSPSASGAVTFTTSETILEGASSTSNIILSASRDIVIQNLSDNLLDLKQVSGTSVTFTAGGAITFNDTADVIQTRGGNLTFDAIGKLTLGGVDSNGGNITLKGSDMILKTVDAGSGSINILSSNGGTIGLENAAASNSTVSTICGGACGITLNSDEITGFKGGSLTVGDATNGNVYVDGVAVHMSGSVTLNATKSTGSVVFSGSNSSFDRALAINAGNGVDLQTSAIALGKVDINADSDSNGTGTFSLASGKTVSSKEVTLNQPISIVAADFLSSGVIDAGTANINIRSTNGRTIGIGDATGNMSISGAEIQNMIGGSLSIGDGSTGSITVNNLTLANLTGIAGSVSLDAQGDNASLTFSGVRSYFKSLSATADDGINVNVDVDTTVGNLTLDGNSDNATDSSDKIAMGSGVTLTSAGNMTLDATTGGITGAGGFTLNATSGKITINDNLSSSGATNVNAGTGIQFGNGISVTAGSNLSLSSTTGGITALGSISLLSSSGITLTDNFTANGATTVDADTDKDGSGTFTVNAGKTLSTSNNALTITAGDIALSGSLNSGTAGTTILVSKSGNSIGLGATAGALTLDGTELQNITAASLTLGNSSAGSVTVNGISAANSNNVGSLALTSGSSIAFSGGDSTFNALTATGSSISFDSGRTIATDTGILSLNTSSVTSAGALTLTGATGINFGAGTTFSSGGNLAMTTGSGDINAAGAFTLTSTGDITLSENLITAGTTSITAGSGGTGDFIISAGTLSTGGNALTLKAVDIDLTGSINTGTGAMTVLTSTSGGTIGLGGSDGTTMTLTGADLQKITAGTLTFGDSTTGNITVDGVTTTHLGTISGGLVLNAKGNGSTVSFSNNASTLNALTANAENGIIFNVDATTNGATVLNTDSDADGTGGLTIAATKTLSTTGNSLSVTTNGLSFNSTGAVNTGSAGTTLLGAVSANTIALGGSSFSATELGRFTTGSFTVGDSSTGGVSVDGLSLASTPLTVTGGSVSFVNNASSLKDLTATATTGTITGTTALTVSGASSFTTSTADQAITLNNTGNSFTGAVSLNTSGSAGHATLASNSDLTLGTSSVGGNLSTTVGGTTKTLTVAGVQTAGGTISLASDDDIIFNTAGGLTAGGNVSVTADNDNSNSGTGGAVTMADGAVINSGAATLSISADEDITVGRLVTTNASDSAITLTSKSKGVLDAGDTGGADIEAQFGRLVADMVTGFGTASNAIETRVFSVDMDNTTSGDVNFFETDSLEIFKVKQLGPGDITVSYSGSLTGQDKATIPLLSTGKIAFIQRLVANSRDLLVGGTGKTLGDLAAATTVNANNEIANTFPSSLLGETSLGSKTVGHQVGLKGPGSFIVDVFSEDFSLIELDPEAREVYGDLKGFESFWGTKKPERSEFARQDGKIKTKDESAIRPQRKQGGKKKQSGRLETKAKNEIKRVKKIGETASAAN